MQNPQNKHDSVLEKQILYSMIHAEEALLDGLQTLEPSDFYEPVNKKIFETMSEMFQERIPVDSVSLLQLLKTKNGFKEESYSEIFATTNYTPNTKYLMRVCKQHSTLRQIGTLTTKIRQEADNLSSDPFELLEKMHSEIIRLSEPLQKKQPKHLKTLLNETIEKLGKLHSGEIKALGVSSTYNKLDELLGGFEPNNLYVIAGRPSMGKTALALNLSVRMSENVPILYFSLETGEFDLCVRMLTQISRARSWSMKTGHIGTDQWQHLIHDAGNLYKSNLIIDDSAKLTVMNLTTKIQHIINQYHVKGIVIDYLGLMTADSAETRSLEIGNITRQLKIIAKEYEVFIILLSQLNRLVESRPDKIPTLSDLRESGSVEQDADAVLFVYRPEYYDIKTVNNHTTENYAEIIIAKNRITGITGVVPMTYIKQHTRYENYTEEVNYREVRPKPPEATIFDTPF